MARDSRPFELIRLSRGLIPVLAALVACRPAGHDGAAADSAFAGVQARGAIAMGVDQYTSHHRFEPLPDGGRIALQRDPDDSAGAVVIRKHMAEIARAFRAGDFRLPGFVHAREVPGTAEMSSRRDAIEYLADTLPGGGEVRIRSADPAAVRAVHEFLAFQRSDHRAGTHP